MVTVRPGRRLESEEQTGQTVAEPQHDMTSVTKLRAKVNISLEIYFPNNFLIFKIGDSSV